MDGAIEPKQGKEEEPDPTVVAVAFNSIVESNRAEERAENGWSDDEEEDKGEA